MVTAWRMLKTKHLVHAFDGEGARRFGGRWNSVGIPICYCAAHVSLAALEILAHLQATGPLTSYSVLPVTFAPDLVERISVTELPADWAASPAPTELRRVGDGWANAQRSAVLEVPSVIVPQESIYLVNPQHPDFSKIRLGKPEAFALDPRLLK
jgi:RES domain-containing protein